MRKGLAGKGAIRVCLRLLCLICSALLLLAFFMHALPFKQTLTIRDLPSAQGKYGWSFELPKLPLAAILTSGEPPCNPELSLIIGGSKLNRNHASFDDILNLGDGRFNQWGNRVFFSLPASADYKALADIRVERPLYFKFYFEMIVLSVCLVLLRFSFGDKISALYRAYLSFAASKKIPASAPALSLIALSIAFYFFSSMPHFIAFASDSETYISPGAGALGRTFAYPLFLKIVLLFTKDLYWLGPLQWTIYAVSVISLASVFERFLRSPLTAFLIGTLLLSKIGVLQWAFYAGPDLLFESAVNFTFVALSPFLLAEAGILNCFAVASIFMLALGLRPVALTLFAAIVLTALFGVFFLKNWKLSAVLLTLCLLVFPAQSLLGGLFSGNKNASGATGGITGICLLPTAVLIMDRDPESSYPLLQASIVDACKSLKDEFWSISFEERKMWDQTRWNVIAWERIPAVLAHWKKTPEAAGILDRDSAAQKHWVKAMDKIFQKMAFDVFRQKPKESMELLWLRLNQVFTSQFSGDWLIDLSSKFAWLNERISDNPVCYAYSKYMRFEPFACRDVYLINTQIMQHLKLFNAFMLALLSTIPFSLFYAFRKGKIDALLALTSISSATVAFYWLVVCVMQPPIIRYSEPVVPLSIFSALAQLLYLIRLALSSMKPQAKAGFDQSAEDQAPLLEKPELLKIQ
ncbi:MAG: hypothetical protein K2X27_26465 [Candidatus Obscuribacterales bacterium]|nr:hypothetical protein [Candidatus Obscuribacterales bacterium]